LNNNPIILLIETSGEVCSVAVAKGDSILGEKAIIEPNAHSTYLASLVNDLLTETNYSISDLSAVAISGGPGSYTGLRIGCSLAKGFCFATGVPLLACSTLKALASAAFDGTKSKNDVISLVDARRMDAYVGVFNADLKELEEEHFATLDDDFNARFTNPDYLVVGSGAQKWLDANKSQNLTYFQTQLFAKHMLPEALEKFKKEDFSDVAYYEPNYIKSVYVTKPKPKF
jgi:tRNA threonylcarbamoyladenosine biosynthesis protein TsaB